MAIEELIFKNWRINWRIYRPFGKIQFMNTNIDRIIGRIRFSLFRPKANWSLIQIRMMLSDGRFTYYLPRQLKINPLYWDNQNGCAVIDSKCRFKREPDIKKTFAEYKFRNRTNQKYTY